MSLVTSKWDEPFELSTRRIGMFTASIMPALCNRLKTGAFKADAKSVIYRVAIERLTGAQEHNESYLATRRGNELEPEAKACYVTKCGDMLNCDFVASERTPTLGATPDGITPDLKRLLQFKCPLSMSKHLSYIVDQEVLLSEYRWQIQTEMYCAGVDQIQMVSFHPAFARLGADLFVTRVVEASAADRETIERNVYEAEEIVRSTMDKMRESIAPIVKASKDVESIPF